MPGFTGNTELLVGVAGVADSAANIANSPPSSFTLVNNSGQLIATVTQIVPVLKPISIQANTFSGTTAFLSMSISVQQGKTINVGDALSFVSSVSGIVATFAFFAGAPVTLTVATAVGVTAGVASLITSDNVNAIKQWIADQINEMYPSSPIVATPNLYAGYHGGLLAYQDISPERPAKAMVCIMEFITHGPWLCTESPEEEPNDVEPPTCDDSDGDGLSC